MNAVTASLGSDIDDGVADASSLAVEDLIDLHQAQSEGIHQRIARITDLELGLAAEVRHAKAVAVAGNTADDALDDRVILADQLVSIRPARNGPEAQRIHHRQRPCAHGEDIAQNA